MRIILYVLNSDCNAIGFNAVPIPGVCACSISVCLSTDASQESEYYIVASIWSQSLALFVHLSAQGTLCGDVDVFPVGLNAMMHPPPPRLCIWLSTGGMVYH